MAYGPNEHGDLPDLRRWLLASFELTGSAWNSWRGTGEPRVEVAW